MRVRGLPPDGRGRARRPGEPDVVRRVGRRLREEAIFVMLWAMVISAANAIAMLAAAMVGH